MLILLFVQILSILLDLGLHENSWDVVDASGAVIASGANASGDVGACAVYGCTDPAASNYDAAANTDDGSCIVCTDNWVTISCGGGSFQSEVSWTLLNSSGTAVLTGGAGVFGAPLLWTCVYLLTVIQLIWLIHMEMDGTETFLKSL